MTPSGLRTLSRRLEEIITQAQGHIARSVNSETVRAYWLVGWEIVEEKQGAARAGYGEAVIDHLSAHLLRTMGKGYTSTNPRYMRLFYLAYPNLLGEIRHAPRDELPAGTLTLSDSTVGTLDPNCRRCTTGCSPRWTRPAPGVFTNSKR